MFPHRAYTDAGCYLVAYANAIRIAMASVDRLQLNRAAGALFHAVDRRASIFVCGNGGSAAIANHFAQDHQNGVRRGTTLQPRVHSLCSNIAILTALTNDSGYATVFSSQLASLAAPGDLLVTISSSGASPNILTALDWARDNGLDSIALTGFGGGDARTLADIPLHVESDNYGVVEDVHQALMHILAQYLRHARLEDPSSLGQVRF